jgi:hypothetical protein
MLSSACGASDRRRGGRNGVPPDVGGRGVPAYSADATRCARLLDKLWEYPNACDPRAYNRSTMATERKIAPEPEGPATPSYTKAPSAEEIARRKRAFEETFKLRAAIGPVRMTMAELLSHRTDEEEDE